MPFHPPCRSRSTRRQRADSARQACTSTPRYVCVAGACKGVSDILEHGGGTPGRQTRHQRPELRALQVLLHQDAGGVHSLDRA